ncbi:MAG: hypothetical protein JWR38_4416 [Mucilaginibacter sp.]|nr:hypothetical protein [Mucilaginibacter sp.]
MKPTLSQLLLIPVFLLWSWHLQAQNLQTRRIDSLMQAANSTGVFNGNVLVAQHGKAIYHKAIGYADATKSKMLNPDLYFDIGSISKEFNGIGIMILQEQGKLRLSDPVAKYLPYLPEWAKHVKLLDLVNYTSGLPVSNAMADSDYYNILNNLKTLAFEPGKSYIYSNDNVYLQKRIIEKVSGLSFNDFVVKYIFKPCKMLNSGMDLKFNDPKMAQAFDSNYRPTPYTQESSGWVRLTMDDLYRYTTCLNSYQLIKHDSYQELAAGFGDGESSLGSAQFENNQLIWHQHHGSNYNYEALMTSDLKEDITVILMTNSQQFKVSPLTTAIMNIIKGKPYTVPQKSLYLDLREKVLANFDMGIAFYRSVHENPQSNYDLSFEIGDLVNTGKYLMRRNKFDEAIQIFNLGTLLKIKNTDYSLVYQLIGESYAKKGNKDTAILYYIQAVAQDADNKVAKGFLAELHKN